MPRDGETVPARGLFEAIGLAYAEWRPASSSMPEWTVLVQTYRGNVAAAANVAYGLAQRAGAGLNIKLGMVRTGRSFLPEADRERIKAEVLGEINDHMSGQMQAMLAGSALADFEVILPALLMTGRACAQLSVDGQGRGTGFLVGADLLLTAGHVLYDLIDNGGKPLPGSAGRIAIRFPAPPNAPQGWPTVPTAAAEDWLLFWSDPTGQPPVLKAATTSKLDCALIRLEHEIPTVVPRLDIVSPPEGETSLILIVGFVGGSGKLVFDGGEVLKLDTLNGRVRHRAGAVGGMSGSPYIDWKGQVYAVHEGTADVPEPQHNRGVVLHAIRGAMCRDRPDPLLVPRREHLFALSHFDVRAAWEKAGAAWSWPGALHPVFGRVSFQDWITQGGGPDQAAPPFAFISGDPGTGKSFSLDILRARLGPASDALAHITPEVIQIANGADILARVGVAAGLPPNTLPTVSDIAPRPDDGTRRLDLLEPGLAVLAAAAGRGTWRRLWLFADMGSPEAWRVPGVQQFWADLLKLALPHRGWLRIVIAGLHQDVAASLAINVGRNLVFRERIAEVSWEELWPIVQRRGAPGGSLREEERLNAWLAAVDASGSRKCIESVRFVIGLP